MEKRKENAIWKVRRELLERPKQRLLLNLLESCQQLLAERTAAQGNKVYGNGKVASQRLSAEKLFWIPESAISSK